VPRDYLAQRIWWVEQFAYLLDQLAARPEDGATMLDHSLVLLATVAGLCQISRYDADRWGDFWRFTATSAERLARSVFAEVEVQSYGNVLGAKALLDGLAVEELPDPSLLDDLDLDYPVVLGIRATGHS
jgi:hypothetical protein